MPNIAPATKRLTVTTIAGRTADGEAEITISTNSVDREQDELLPEGCDLRNYQRNPVVLFGHDSYDLPVGICTSIKVEATGLRAAWRWLQNDPRAERVKNAYDQGVLRAASVGFRPLAYEPNAHGGYRFTKWELLEWSLVPVPANPDAVRTLKSLGLYGPSSVTHLNLAIQQLTADVKAGRVLSGADERRLREAMRTLTDVMRDDDQTAPGADDGMPTHISINGQRVALTAAMLRRAVSDVVADSVCAVTGRLPDGPAAVFVTEPSIPIVRISEAHLSALIREVVQDAFNKVTGRVDG